ncbi:type VI secretion system protein TssA [Aestuariibacter salexigens]|uniref:type VI secretion system protein TssA n=1 Tax=Aestuariibacter salexigens TaxID=226010 RepID=UPI00040FBAA2|nr:type VI secretion system protein TssA [Aestuariibacter salexigens]
MEKDTFATLLAPIGDGPGEDPATFAEFDDLEAELAKLEGIERVPVDWKKIAKLAEGLLSTQTKDLRVGGYLAYSAYQQSDFAGLCAGFELFKGLVEAPYWEEIFPRRRKRQGKARAAAFAWLAGRLDKDFEAREVSEQDDLESVVAAFDGFMACDAALAEKLGEDAPSTFELRAKFKRLNDVAAHLLEEKKQAEEAQSEPEPEPEQSASTPESTTPTPSPTPTPPPAIAKADNIEVSAESLDKALAGAGRVLQQVADLLKKDKPFDETALHYARQAKWLQVRVIPASGVMPPIPSADVMKQLEQLEQQKQFEQLANQAEAIFNSGAIFCLSLQRYIYAGLKAIGQQAAADTVKRDTAVFLEMHPQLKESTFNDGSPFVDEKTLLWLSQGGSSQAPDGNNSGASQQNSIIDEAYQKALELSAEDGFASAIEAFTSATETAQVGKDHADRQLLLAELCKKNGREDVSVYILERLRGSMQTQMASHYDTKTFHQVSAMLLGCYDSLQTKKQLAADKSNEIEELKREVFAFNPIAALDMTRA